MAVAFIYQGEKRQVQSHPKSRSDNCSSLPVLGLPLRPVSFLRSQSSPFAEVGAGINVHVASGGFVFGHNVGVNLAWLRSIILCDRWYTPQLSDTADTGFPSRLRLAVGRERVSESVSVHLYPPNL